VSLLKYGCFQSEYKLSEKISYIYPAYPSPLTYSCGVKAKKKNNKKTVIKNSYSKRERLQKQ
jgi:hypothetical protein